MAPDNDHCSFPKAWGIGTAILSHYGDSVWSLNCYFCWRKKVKAEANNQKKNNFLSVRGSFVKITNILQVSPNCECSESCQTRLGCMACWTEGWNNTVWNRWGQHCALPNSAVSASTELPCGQRLASHTQKYFFVLVESRIFWTVRWCPKWPHVNSIFSEPRAVLSVGSSTRCELRIHLALDTVLKNPLTRGSFTLPSSFSPSLFLNYTNGEKTHPPSFNKLDNSWLIWFSSFC